MTLADRILTNAFIIDEKEADTVVGPLLTADEVVTHSYMVGIRDLLFFTNKRLISCDKQTVNGKKKDIVCYPWRNVFWWQFTSAGNLDFDTELTIAAKSMGLPLAVTSPGGSPSSIANAPDAFGNYDAQQIPPPPGPLVITFSKDVDIKAIAKTISSYVLSTYE